jgi:FkbM family methyltransferase
LIEAPSLEQFRTPRGRAASLYTRPGTNDHNTLYSCLDGDEYGLANLDLGDAVALDIGAYTGGVTIALALDNPDAHILAVEALSANVEVLRLNLEANEVTDRVTVIHGAAAEASGRQAKVHWNFSDTESGQHHRFVGNAQWPGDIGVSEKVRTWSLGDLPSDIAFAKIDCEMCEYGVFKHRDVARLAVIVGEYHGGIDRLIELLDATHVVTQTGGYETTGAFRAVRR